MDKLIEGCIVHYVLNEGKHVGEHRPAIVVKVWRTSDGKAPENGCSQLQVFTDKDNDGLPTILVRTSVTFDESGAPGSWHWTLHAVQEEPTLIHSEEIASPTVQEDPAPTGSQ